MNMRTFIVSVTIIGMFFSGTTLNAEQALLESVVDGCKVELDTYCMDVTPGESRILACLYSRSDKLSGKCEYALYDAAVQLERAVAALSYVVNECAEDVNKLCGSVEAGEGRLLDCLDKNAAEVSMRCKDAINKVISK